MSETKLTEHFRLSEFTRVSVESIPKVQMFLIKSLANQLEAVRTILTTEFRKSVPIHITSGWRTREDFDRLVSQGYHPSETSDHYYGVPISIQALEKKLKWGDVYSYSVGATDIIPVNVDIEKAFEVICQKAKDKILFLGQVIHEYNRAKGQDWIHLSNSPLLMYSQAFVNEFLLRSQFLVSNDGGVSYNAK